MAQSENVGELALALCQFQSLMKAVEKGEENDGIKKAGKPIKYADLASMVEAAKPHLTETMLSVTGTLGVEILGDQIIDTLETTLMHKSGQWKSGKQRLFLTRKAQGGGLYESLDSQTQGSAISYARRYGFCAILNLITDDDDGQAATNEQRRQIVEGPEPEDRPKYQENARTANGQSQTVNGPAATIKEPVPKEEWTALMEAAQKLDWPPEYVKLCIETEDKRGRQKDERSLFNWAKAKFSKQNERAETK